MTFLEAMLEVRKQGGYAVSNSNRGWVIELTQDGNPVISHWGYGPDTCNVQVMSRAKDWKHQTKNPRSEMAQLKYC